MANILVVDDSRSMRELISMTLREAGHQVQTAEDGVDGLGCAEKMSYDLVITDVNMPRMKGLELTGKLRELGAYKFTPILVLTTETDGDLKQQAKGAGATGWLVKPFDPNGLLATINRVLK